MKSELVLKMEEPPKPPTPRPTDEVPPPLPFPLRFEYTSTSVAEILRTLQDVLTNEKAILAKKPFVLSPPSVFEQLDEFLANMEENIQKFYAELIKRSIRGVPLSFRKMVARESLIQIVRVFIMLLFLAHQKKVVLTQGEQSSDILIRLGEVAPPIA
jgi:chromatin segregation and condensation protein Rec8/ScpA/Scc1 (kleisin family)